MTNEFEDKPRRHQRWLMALESVKGADHPKLDNQESWHTTLLAMGFDKVWLIGHKGYRTKAIDATLQNPEHVALLEHDGVTVHYKMRRES